MWHAGLRGGIALVLTLSFDEWVNEVNKDEHTIGHLRTATLVVICVFLLVFGGSTELCLKGLGIPCGNPPPMFLQPTCFSRLLFKFHKKFLKPTLTGGDEKRVTMHGSVMQSIMEQAKMRDQVDR